jgi:hypothetical protein
MGSLGEVCEVVPSRVICGVEASMEDEGVGPSREGSSGISTPSDVTAQT